MNVLKQRITWLLAVMVLVLSACGGGGGGGGDGAAGSPEPGVVPGPGSAQLAQMCAKGNPFASSAATTTRDGTLEDEKRWIRAYMDERYLWYRDIPSLDLSAPRYNPLDAQGQPRVLESLVNVFQDSRTPKLTSSGTRVDKFSFMIDTYSWNNFSAGQDLGYGWMLRQTGTGTDKRWQVAYVYPTLQAGLAFAQGILRGDEIVSIDGYTAQDSNPGPFNQALSPSQPGAHEFVLQRRGERIRRTLVAQTVELPQAEHRIISANGLRWGYLMFNSHVRSAEQRLLQAMRDFSAQGIDELVLDLRYNGGGYLAIASALANAIAGDERTRGRVFEQTRFNDKRSASNFSMGFYGTTLFTGQSYTRLNLSRLYVLTSKETCSASESLINALRGVDVQVVQIGGTTCGKPYGFYPQDNCGITYAAMEFEGVNDKGEGGFSDGIAPVCVARDDLGFALADPAEPLFATAIAHRQGRVCVPPAARGLIGSASPAGGDADSGPLLRPDWQRNKYTLQR